ncbi:uncharacterized protein [Triticum aestivum]|uniref:uncharacterized protein n=1 Tax=Triticum aestivum TaxID=4565 RepID=UPI001D028055|nr:uncharacterized protein LOC123140828 [Triticum aestivum]
MSIPAPLEDEDLLREILLRLPPLPSTLSRASLVCTRWRRILSDPRFLRRFSRHHPEPPLLGFFKGSTPYPFLIPVLDPPDRIPAERFFLPEITGDWEFLGCRHGLAVMLSESLCEVFVWDPLNGQQHRVPFPLELRDAKRESFCRCSATVMCVDDQDGHVQDDCFLNPSFKLVLICSRRDLKTSLACAYESVSGVWGNIVSASTRRMVMKLKPSILIRSAVYWLLHGGQILAFDIQRQTLAVIETPVDAQRWSFQLLRTDEDSVLGLAAMSKLGIHIWERKLNSDGVAGWVLLQKINQLEGMLSNDFINGGMVGYDEELNVVVLSTYEYLTKNYHNSRKRDRKLPLYDFVPKTTTFLLIRGKKLPSVKTARFAWVKPESDCPTPHISGLKMQSGP